MRTRFLAFVTASLLLVSTSGAAFAEHSVQELDVCCAWGSALSDGDLTYKISGADSATHAAITAAVEEWESAVPGLTLTEVTEKRAAADINIRYKKGGGRIQGSARRQVDSQGFVAEVQVSVSGKAFGQESQVARIIKHEVGHALGLGHANFNGDLLSTTVNNGSDSISACDVDGVLAANKWKLVDGSSAPAHPTVTHVAC